VAGEGIDEYSKPQRLGLDGKRKKKSTERLDWREHLLTRVYERRDGIEVTATLVNQLNYSNLKLSSTSFLVRKNTYLIAVLLLDLTIKEGFPLWRGYRNWSCKLIRLGSPFYCKPGKRLYTFGKDSCRCYTSNPNPQDDYSTTT